MIGPDGEVIETCTILTTEANETVRELHGRIPVIIAREHYDKWLNPDWGDANALQALFKPYPAEEMTLYPVSFRVNNVRYDDAGLLQPVTIS